MRLVLPTPKPEHPNLPADPERAESFLTRAAWTAIALCILFVATRTGLNLLDFKQLLARQHAGRTQLLNQHQAQTLEEEEQHRTQIEQIESAHQSRLGDQGLMSGETARARHAKEWARRMAHDPSLANTPVEKTLVRMQSLGADPAYAPRKPAFL